MAIKDLINKGVGIGGVLKYRFTRGLDLAIPALHPVTYASDSEPATPYEALMESATDYDASDQPATVYTVAMES